MFRKNLPDGIIKFLLLVFITIFVTYKAPRILAYIWYITTLILYFRSNDEPFWLAFYFTTVDGFLGFFGLYTVTINIFPGLPAVELAQFYILLSFIKAIQVKNKPFVFYNKYLTILLMYMIFLIIWGQMMGFSGEARDYFRIIKLTLPFLLFYTLPRLFPDYESFKRLFGFMFVILICAFLTQLFVLFTGLLPAKITELTPEQASEAGGYRGFFNIGVTLMGLFGALFFLSEKSSEYFSKIYLYILILSAYGMAYISATRGWIISFSFIIIFSFLFIPGIRIKNIAQFSIFFLIVISIAFSSNILREQITFATSRVGTLKELAEGDITAGGTLSRLSRRSPRVMNIFKQNPVFGWGFSDISRKYSDGHVGNQTILLNSGVIGFILLIGFMVYFSFKLIEMHIFGNKIYLFRNSMPVFIIFLIGWFFIHSTSGQHFHYLGIPDQIIPQAIFFSFGALVYSESKKSIYG